MKLVLIEWVDAHTTGGWNDLDELEESCEPLHCRSVGWLLCKKNNYVVVVPHMSGEKNGDIKINGRGHLAIPTKTIQKMTVLRNK